MTKQEQARWDEVRNEIAKYLTKRFVWYDDAEFPKDECHREAEHILSMASIAVLHPEQELPKAQVLFSGLYTEESVYKQAQQDMRGWKRVI